MRGRSGLSETVAVLALVVAAIAVGVAITLFAVPFTRSAASGEGFSISTASLRVISGSRAILVIGLANTGDSELTVGGVSVSGPGSPSCSASSLPRLQPGQSVEILLECSNISRDASYVVSVSAQTAGGRALLRDVKVRAL